MDATLFGDSTITSVLPCLRVDALRVDGLRVEDFGVEGFCVRVLFMGAVSSGEGVTRIRVNGAETVAAQGKKK